MQRENVLLGAYFTNLSFNLAYTKRMNFPSASNSISPAFSPNFSASDLLPFVLADLALVVFAEGAVLDE